MNWLSAAELKRRGMAAVEERLRRGPVHIVKRNKPAAVVLTEADYARLVPVATKAVDVTAIQWLLSQSAGAKSKTQLDKEIHAERGDWA